MSTRSVLLCLALLACFVAGHFTATAWPHFPWPAPKSNPGTEGGKASPNVPDPTAPPETLRLMGRLAPKDGIVDVGATPGDRLVELNVLDKPTDSVKKGDQLGKLESFETRQLECDAAERRYEQAKARRTAELDNAKAQLAAAEEALKQASVEDPQVSYQRRQVALAEHNVKLAKADLARLEQLRSELVSQPEKDRQALVVEQAELELFAAQSALERSEQAAEFQQATAEAQFEVARTAVERADSMTKLDPLEAELKLAQRRLRDGLVLAPSAGRVIAVLTRPGQLVKSGPILQIADTSYMVCVAEVHESDINRVCKDQPVEITSPALNGKVVKGKVESIGLQAGSPQLRSLDPLASQNRHAIEVRIELDDLNSAIVRNLTDLQVDVEITLGNCPPQAMGEQ